jgi:hypothetical protein
MLGQVERLATGGLTTLMGGSLDSYFAGRLKKKGGDLTTRVDLEKLVQPINAALVYDTRPRTCASCQPAARVRTETRGWIPAGA